MSILIKATMQESFFSDHGRRRYYGSGSTIAESTPVPPGDASLEQPTVGALSKWP